MPLRTSETAIREIISTSLTTAQINAFAADANLFVTEEIAAIAPAISAARLEIIERWLACALVRARDLGLSSTSRGNVSENYQVDATVTEYLQHAAAMDPTGAIRRKFLATEETFRAMIRVGETFLEDSDDPVDASNDP